MTKQNTKSSNPLGPLHSDSINRASKVPDAAKGFANTTPGTTQAPLIIAGDTPKKEPKK